MGVGASEENNEKKPVVLIVGGGYGGVQCAKVLDKTGQFFIVLIDRKSYFLHNVATLRATVEQNYAQQILIPYDRLLTNGCVVQAEVIAISNDSVRVHGRNDPIHFDYLVIATGSSYAFPGKVAEVETSKAIHLYDSLRQKVEKYQNILIIGGGAVGVELAGEIATDYPGKEITLVHSQPTLLQPNVFKEKLYVRLQEQLEKLHVKVILNDRVKLSEGKDGHVLNYIEGNRTYQTETGRIQIPADLAFICTGARVNNRSILNGSLKSKLNPESGRLLVNNYLQVDGFEKIFAIGDISDKEGKYAYLAGEQADYVAKLIPLIEKKKPYPKEYAVHVYPAIFVTVGRNGGTGQLWNKSGTVVGDLLVKFIKSKDMFTSRYRSMFNLKSEARDKTHSLRSMLTLTEQEAQELLAGLPVQELKPGQDFI